MGVALIFCWSLAAENTVQPVRDGAAEVVEGASSSATAVALKSGVSKPTSQILAGVSATVPADTTPQVVSVSKRTYAGIDSTAELESRHVLVRFAASADSTAQVQALSAVSGATIVRKYTLVPGLALVEIPATQGVNEALEAINQSQQVLYAEPNYVRHLQATPNDPRFGDLWGLYNIGQSGGTADDDIDATEAWDRVNDASGIIVADVDTGMDYTHPDLAGNRWVNKGEIPGNGIDDDGNGYVDDVYGYDAINGDGDPMDDHGHGSHTAGTIGALGNNGVGVAGVCWRAKIMAVKIFDDAGNTTAAAIIEGWQYAADQGARVMNNSWGGGPYSQAEKDAIDALGVRNIIYIASAGNSNLNMDSTPSYPASYDCANIISVIATDRHDTMAGFSNYGATTADLAAPGVEILSCAPGGGYQYMDGTSMAAPHVTGACALLLAVRPDLTVAQVKNALMATADPLATSGLCVSNGRLNVFHALASVGQWDLLHDNGPFINSLGTGVGGADESVVQTGLGMDTTGWVLSSPQRLADQFTVPAGQTWRLKEIQIFTGEWDTTTESAISVMSLRVWNGKPGVPGSAVLYGDTTTNRLVRSEWVHSYRRHPIYPDKYPIVMNTLAVDLNLPSGTYWLDWGSPSIYLGFPLTIAGQTTTGDAIWGAESSWATMSDFGTNTPQGLPFLVKGLNGNLAVSPMEGMSSTGYPGRTFTPAQKVYTLSNDSTETALTWSVQTPAGLWWHATPASGTLAPSGTASVTVSLDAASAAPGVTTASLVVWNQTENTSISLPPLMLTVKELPGVVSVTDSALPADDLAVPFGDTIVGLQTTQTVTVRNTDSSHPLWVGGVSLGRYVENFDDGLAQNWQALPSSNWKVENGEYVSDGQLAYTQELTSLYQGESWQDCSFQVDVQISGSGLSGAGIVARATDNYNWNVGSGYLFLVVSNGNFLVWRTVGGSPSLLITASASSALNLLGSNRLLVTVSGSTLEFYVNGSLMWRGTDSGIPGSGRVGLHSVFDRDKIVYDNVVVESPLPVYVSSISAEQQWCLDLAAQGWQPEEVGVLSLAGVRAANPVALSVSQSESFRLFDLPTTFPLTLAPGAEFTFQVAHQPQRVGGDTGTIQVRTNDLDHPDVQVALSGTGLPAPLSVTPEGDVWSQGPVGGPFVPTTHTFTLAATGSLTWSVSASQPWVTVSPTSGTLSNASTSVAVGLNAQAVALPEGVYEAALTFHDASTGLDTTRTVRLQAFTTPQMEVAPASLSASILLGGATSQTLTIGNAAAANANLSVRLTSRETKRVLAEAVAALEEPAARDFAQIQGAYASDFALVRFKPGTSEATRASVAASVGAEIARTYRIIPDLVLLRLPAGSDLTAILVSLNQNASVLYAEPDYQRVADGVPNDPNFSSQWNLRNVGQNGGTAGADIQAVAAWDRQTGDPNVVAVIDTGINSVNPDLVHNLWLNQAEVPGNGVDDDGNGYVDDVNGYDFISDVGNPTDSWNGHGIAVASVIGAQGNNAVGIAGVCWQTRLMALKALDSNGIGYDSNLIQAFEYALMQDARIINASWGGEAYSQSLKDAIDAANGAGAVVVAAAGNTGANLETTPHYPASYGSKNIVSVLGTNNLDQKASASSYGAVSVDLGAPGQDIPTVLGTRSGSSYAAAHVSGVCALLLSSNPLARVQDLKKALLDGVDPVLPGAACVSGGRLNAARALDLLPRPWLTLTPNAFSAIAPGTTQTVVVGFNNEDAFYSAGTYQAEILIESNDRARPAVTVPVTLTIATDSIRVAPSDLQSFSGTLGGPFSPASTTYVMSNVSTASSFDYTVTTDGAWLDISPASGTLAPGSSVTVQVTPGRLANLLDFGLHAATVEFLNSTSGARIPCRVELDVTSISPELLATVLAYDFPLDTDPGWTVTGGWAWGVPTGVSGDPVAGHTGTNVYGYNLSGAYSNNMVSTEYLMTQPLDFTGYRAVSLQFWRWLGVENSNWDHATIDVSNDNGVTWTSVWTNPNSIINENAWSFQAYDLSAVAAGHANVRVRWGMGTTDGTITYSGWNIDDIQFYGNVFQRQLTVSPATGLAAQGAQHGTFEPTSATYVLTNTTTGSLTWSVAKSAPWFDVAPAAGSLLPGETASVTAALNDQTLYLHGGLHSDSLVFFSPVGIPKTRPVSVNVSPYHTDALYYFPFDTDPGWTCQGQWAFGTPQGLAGDHGFPDPTSGHTGSNVYGYNLAGGYPNSLASTQYLISGPLNFAGQSLVYLEFWRWLGVEQNIYDHASIDVSNDNGATWTSVWANPNATINENVWSLQTYDLSAVAAGHPQVRVRWGMGACDNAWSFAGWNIDDVLFRGEPKLWHDLAAEPGTGFDADGAEGGPFAPSSTTYALTNLTTQTLTWEVLNPASLPAWLQVSEVGGTLAVGATSTVQVGVSSAAAALPAGIYTYNLEFADVAHPANAETRSVCLTIRSLSGEIAVLDSVAPADDRNVSFGESFIGTVTTQTVTVQNSSPDRDLTVTSVTLAASPVYSEDFSDGLAQGWQPAAGTWPVVGGEYQINPAGTNFTCSKYMGRVFKDGVFEVKTRRRPTDSGSGYVSLVLRASSDFDDISVGTGYEFAINARTGQYEIYYGDGNLWSQISAGSSPAILSAINTLRVSAQGTQFKFYANGTLLWQGSDSRLATGYVGVGGQAVVGQPVFYDNFRVETDTSVFHLQKNLPAFPLTLTEMSSATFEVGYEPWFDGLSTGTLMIASNDSTDPVVTVALNGTGVSGDIEVTPGEDLAALGHPGGPFTPSSTTYTLSNPLMKRSLEYAVSVNQPWVSVSLTTGTLAVQTTQSLTVSLNAAADLLAAGDHVADVTIRNLVSGAEVKRRVTLSVFTSPSIGVTPASLSASLLPGAESVTTLTVSNDLAADENLNVNLMVEPVTGDVSWLSTTPTVVTALTPGNAQVIQVRFAPETVLPGSYEANLVVTSNDFNTPVVRVPVTLTVLDEGLRVNSLNVWNPTGSMGGEFTPDRDDLTVSNMGTSALTWSAGTSSTWCEVAPAGGTLAAGESVSATLRLTNAAYLLAPGTYTTQVAFTNPATGSVYRRTVTLTVEPAPLDAASLSRLYWFPLDTDPGWTVQGQWAFGTPTGGAGDHGNPDPTSGHTGTNVYGYNLAGGYPLNMPSTQYLISEPLDFTGYNMVALEFWRWLGVEQNQYDHASIDVSNDNGATWTNVWANPNSTIDENAWSFQSYDISAVAAGHSQVRVRWGMGISDNTWSFAGWNIDDIAFLAGNPSSLKVSPAGSVWNPTGREGGPFTPATAQYRLRNVGTDLLGWDSVTSAGWVVATPTSGTLTPGEAVDVTLSLDTTTTAFAGTYPLPTRYADQVAFFQTNGTSSTTQTAVVNLDVTTRPGRIKVLDSVPSEDDLRVPFGNRVAGVATTETVTVHNSDPTHELVLNSIDLLVSTDQFLENFEDGVADGWVTGTPSLWEVTAGEYRVATSGGWATSKHMNSQWGNVSAQVDVRAAGTTGGAIAALLLRASDDFAAGVSGSAYELAIDLTGNFRVAKYLAGTVNEFVVDTTPVLNTGATALNTLRLDLAGNQIRAYLNGTLVWSGTDSQFPNPGRVALSALTDLGEVLYFDNISVQNNGGVLSAADVASGVGGLEKKTKGRFRLSTPVSFPYSLAPGGDLPVQVGYQPLAVTGEKENVNLVIKSYEDTKPEVVVAVSGRAVSQVLTATPDEDYVVHGRADGSFDPIEKVYVVTNQSTNTAVAWSATASADWFETVPTTGTLSPGTSTSVTVRLTAKAQQLPIGVSSENLTILDVTHGLLAATHVVRAEVLSGAQVSVAPTSVTATLMLGEATTLPLTVSNAPGANEALNIWTSVRETSRSLASVTVTGLKRVQTAAASVGAPDKGTLPPANFSAEAEPNQLLVRFAPSASVPRSGHRVNGRISAEAARAQTLTTICAGATVEKELSLVPGLCVVNVPSSIGVQEAAAALNNSREVLYAEPNYRLKIHETIPNDPNFGLLWGMHNTGQTGGTPDADIDAPEAWDTVTDASNVIVAVIDTGVDYNHEDLKSNIWTNTGEVPGNGLDDDGNGYVDDVHGYDFANGDADPMDDHSHGTHCAGTIGAVGNNGLGVAGVAWKTRIMAMKFLDATGHGDTANAVYCIQYAVQNGAQVLSNSWGGGDYSQTLKDAITAAGSQGVLFVASAGNDYGVNNDVTPSYPASYDCSNIIAVMSTDRNDAVSDFSNIGPNSVDIAAPGSSIYSCLPGSLYGYKSGTSMAAPHVSGACALLLGHNPALTVTQVQQALYSTVDPVVPGYCKTGGRLNLSRALSTEVSWLAVAPKTVSGVVPGSSTTLQVALDAAGLEPGQYRGEVRIDSNDPDHPQTNVPVTLTVQAAGLRVTPLDPVALTGTQGGPFPSAVAEYRVLNPTASAMNWTVTPQAAWLTAIPASGTLAAGESVTVAVSVNSAGNILQAGLHTAQLAFRDLAAASDVMREVDLTITPLPLTRVYYWPLDTNPGWQVDGQWAFGQPTGAGSVAPDPTSGHSGSNVYGYNLSGDYANYMEARYLTSEVIDCSGLRNVTLSFWRWLCVEDSVYDKAAIEVSRDGVNWTTVWSHSEGTLTDTAWQEVSYDISAVADGQSQVQVRWAMGPTDDGNTYAGWNLDDIAILADMDDGLAVSPTTGLVAQGYQEGPFTPASAVYHLTNQTTGTLNWESQISTGSWVTVSPSTGTLAAGQAVEVTVAFSAAAASLPVGHHSTEVTLKRVGNTRGHVGPVDLTVLARPGEVQVLDSIAPQTDLLMPFGAQVVGTRTTQTLTVQNTSSKYPLTLMNVGSTLYKNSFSGSGTPTGWTASPPANWEMVAGEYRAQGPGYMQSMYMDQTWTDVSVRVKVRRGGIDTAMLAVRASDNFSVQPEAGAGYVVGFAANGQFWVIKWIGGVAVWLQPWTPSPFLNPGATTNEMQLVLMGNQLRVYFNGQLAWSGTDNSLTGAGKVALAIFGDTPTDAIYFDDLVVETPDPGLLSVTDAGQSEGVAQPVAPGSLQAALFFDPAEMEVPSAPVWPSVSEMKVDISGGYALSGPDLPMTIPPNGSVTFDVGFEPVSVGDFHSFLFVQTDDLETSLTQVELSGRGVADALDMTPADGFNSVGRPGGPFTPTSATYVVTNVTGTSVSWSAATTQGWIQVTPTAGTLDAHSSVTLTLSLTPAAQALPNGITTDTLTVLNTGTSYTLTRPVMLTVEPTPTVEVDTTPIEVALYVDGQATRTLTIGNAAVADLPLDFTLMTKAAITSVEAKLPKWFRVSPTSATAVAAGSSVDVSVAFSAVHLNPGNYQGMIRINTNDIVHPTVYVPVSLRVSADPLEVSPLADQVSSGVRGTTFAPSQFDYVLTNTGTGSLSWSAALSGGSWLSLDTASGSLASGTSTTVHVAVTLEAALLPVGLYEQNLEVTNLATGSVFRPTVQLVVQPRPQAVVADFPLDSDPGWTREGQWEFGAPQGLGSHDGDPAQAHSGASVFGYNLAGDYANNLTPQSLKTLAIDCSDSTNVQLTFWRWLGVESSDYDHAAVEVSADGTHWTSVWANTVLAVSDHQWTQVAYDISDVADGQPTVYIRWIMGATDDGVTYPGWNIDDVQILGDSLLPDIAVDALGVDFGTLTRAQGSTSRTVTVVNHGQKDLTFSAVDFAGANAAAFSLDPASSLTPLASEQQRAFNVIFTPTQSGLNQADLRIVTNDPDQTTVTVSLIGILVLDAPVLTSEPAFTAGPTNQIAWQPSTDVDVYEAQASPTASFDTPTQQSVSSSTLGVTFVNLTDGQTYWYRVRARDTWGNWSLWSNVTSSTQDNTSPTISALTVSPAVAMEGTTVTVAFSASEPLTSAPLVTVNAHATSLTSQVGLDYVYTYVAQDSVADPDGPAAVRVQALDRVAWAGDFSTTTLLTMDHVAPNYSNFQVTPGFAQQGTTVTFTLTVSETLGQTPVLTVNGNPATVSAVNGLDYTFTYVVGKNPEGLAVLALALRDVAGNLRSASPVVGQTLSVDDTAPAFLNLAATPALARVGTDVELTFSVYDATSVIVDTTPTVTVNGHAATYVTQAGNNYTYRYTVQDAATDPSGLATIRVAGIDLAGNAGQVANTTLLTLDQEAPQVASVVATPDRAAEGREVQLAVTVNEDLTTTPTVTVNGNAVTYVGKAGLVYTFRYTVQGPTADPEGEAVVRVLATDRAGNQTDLKTTSALTLDQTAPVYNNFLVTPGRATEGTTVTIHFLPNEALTSSPLVTVNGHPTVELPIDGLGFAYAYVIQNAATDPDGWARIEVTGFDLAGKQGTLVSTTTLYVDQVAPTFTPVLVTPAVAKEGTTVSLAFEASEALGTTPTVTVNGHAASFETLDGNLYTYLYSVQGAPDDPEGWATLLVEGADLVGKKGSDATTDSLRLDYTAPVFSNLTATPDLAGAGTSVTLTFQVSETLATTPTVQVNNHPAVVLGLSNGVYTFQYDLQASDPDGLATLQVTGADAAGNPGELTNKTLLAVDQTAPVFSNLVAIPVLAKEGTVVTLTFDASEMLATSPTVTVNGHAAQFDALTSLTWTYAYTVGAADVDGAAVIRIAGVDLAGNPGEGTNNTTLTVDKTAPVFSNLVAAPAQAKEGDAVTLTFNVSEALATSPTVTVNGHAAQVVGRTSLTWTCAYTVGTEDADGAAAVRIAGEDLAGNPGELVNSTALWIGVDSVPPVFSSLVATPSQAQEGMAVTLTFTASEILATSPTVTVNGHAAQVVDRTDLTWTCAYTVGAEDAAGAAVIRVTGVDLAGNPGELVNDTALWIGRDTVAPVFSNLVATPGQAKQGTAVTLTFDVSEVLATSPTVTVNGHAAQVVGRTSLMWTCAYTVGAEDTDGAAVIRITGVDLAGNPGELVNSTALWIGVDNVPPVFSNLVATPSVAKEGTAVTLTFSASEVLAANPTVTVNGHAAQYAARVDTAWTFTYTVQPADAEGAATVAVSGTDLADNPGQLESATALRIDKTAPTVTLLSTAPDPVTGTSMVVTALFSEPVTGFEATDVAVTNAVVSGVTADAAGTSYTITLDLSASVTGQVTVSVGAGVAQDAAGNLNGAAESLSRSFESGLPAPTGLMASANTFRILLNWASVTSATAYGIERTVEGTTDTTPVLWMVSAVETSTTPGTNAFVDDTAVPGVTYSYTVTAVDAQQKESDPSTPATATVTAETLVAANYKVTAKGYALTRDASSNLTFTALPDTKPGTIKIALLKKMPANALDNAAKGIYYLTGLTQVPVLKIEGEVKTVAFDVPVYSFEATGLVKSVSAKSVTFLAAREFGTVSITAMKPSESQLYARTFIETAGTSTVPMTIKVKGAVVEEVGSTGQTAQPVKLLSVASKTYKDATKATRTSLGAVGSLPKVVNELLAGGTASIPAEATPCSILGSMLKAVTVSGGPLVADELVGAIDKVTVSGANLRPGLIQSSKNITLIQATAKKVSGVLKGGAVGTAGNPTALVIKAQPPTVGKSKTALTKVYGQTALSGYFYAGYDAATGAAAHTGGIGVLQTKTGKLEGAAFLDPTLVAKMKLLPKGQTIPTNPDL
jgi:subtilisin family serine protease